MSGSSQAPIDAAAPSALPLAVRIHRARVSGYATLGLAGFLGLPQIGLVAISLLQRVMLRSFAGHTPNDAEEQLSLAFFDSFHRMIFTTAPLAVLAHAAAVALAVRLLRRPEDARRLEQLGVAIFGVLVASVVVLVAIALLLPRQFWGFDITLWIRAGLILGNAPAAVGPVVFVALIVRWAQRTARD